ncbi:unnamed protein product, partial [Closterium sp. NIES-54]
SYSPHPTPLFLYLPLSSSHPPTLAHRAWDQFEANRKLFGVETSFDEAIYTTPLPLPLLSSPPSSRTHPSPSSLSTSRAWDQFEANRKLFGVETSFDEAIYTTPLVRPSRELQAHAERIAREIESQPSRNMHTAEVRKRGEG